MVFRSTLVCGTIPIYNAIHKIRAIIFPFYDFETPICYVLDDGNKTLSYLVDNRRGPLHCSTENRKSIEINFTPHMQIAKQKLQEFATREKQFDVGNISVRFFALMTLVHDLHAWDHKEAFFRLFHCNHTHALPGSGDKNAS